MHRRRVRLIVGLTALIAVAAVAASSKVRGRGDAGRSLASSTTPAVAPSPASTQSAWAVPDRPLRVVAYNVYWNQRGVDRVAETITRLDADVVLLSEVPPADLPALAATLKPAKHPLAAEGPYFAASRSASEHGKPATGIISRFPLLDARPIVNPGGREFGVMGEVAFGGSRFCVAAVHLTPTLKPTPQEFAFTEGHRANELAALVREWESRGSRTPPPIVVGGDFNQLAQGPNYETMTRHFRDALAGLGRADWTCQHLLLRTRVDYLLISPDWHATAGGIADSDASDHRPIFIEVGAAKR